MGYEAGWYPDPMGRFEHRYYDGTAWTEHVSSRGEQASDPLTSPGAATPAESLASPGAAAPADTPAPAEASAAPTAAPETQAPIAVTPPSDRPLTTTTAISAAQAAAELAELESAPAQVPTEPTAPTESSSGSEPVTATISASGSPDTAASLTERPDDTHAAPVDAASEPAAEVPEPAAPTSAAALPTEAGWLPDATGRFELRYFDGSEWTEHVASGGQQSVDPAGASPAPSPAGSDVPAAASPAATASASPAATPTASTTASTPATVDFDAIAPGGSQSRKWSFIMLACAGTILLCTVLPWATREGASINGVTWRFGFISAAGAVALAIYASQGLKSDRERVRLHPWAIVGIVASVVAGGMATGMIGDYNDANGMVRADEGAEFFASPFLDAFRTGRGEISYGVGVIFTILAALVAIWPLVMLWRADRRRRRAGLVGPPL